MSTTGKPSLPNTPFQGAKANDNGHSTPNKPDPRHSPTPVRVLTVSGAAGAKAISCRPQTSESEEKTEGQLHERRGR